MRVFQTFTEILVLSLTFASACNGTEFKSVDMRHWREVVPRDEGLRRGSLRPVGHASRVSSMFDSHYRMDGKEPRPATPDVLLEVSKELSSLLKPQYIPAELGAYVSCYSEGEIPNCIYRWYGDSPDEKPLIFCLLMGPSSSFLHLLDTEPINSFADVAKVAKSVCNLTGDYEEKVLFTEERIDAFNKGQARMGRPLFEKSSVPNTYLIWYKADKKEIWARGGKIRLKNTETQEVRDTYGLTICTHYENREK